MFGQNQRYSPLWERIVTTATADCIAPACELPVRHDDLKEAGQMDMEPRSAEPLLSNDFAITPWREARRQLAEAFTYWLVTTGPTGRAHVRPVLAVWVEPSLHFVAGPKSQKARNLLRNPRCSVATQHDDLDLVLEGEASKVSDPARLQAVADAYDSKYDWAVEVREGAFYAEGAPTAGPPPYEVYKVVPTKVYGFGHTETAGFTRWSFAERSSRHVDPQQRADE
jgi:nitroimidazol reductase NimA-like FMN-containing flavoprotein (pyridoxamine 5'-phosphate oxidase superfamily)